MDQPRCKHGRTDAHLYMAHDAEIVTCDPAAACALCRGSGWVQWVMGPRAQCPRCRGTGVDA